MRRAQGAKKKRPATVAGRRNRATDQPSPIESHVFDCAIGCDQQRQHVEALHAVVSDKLVPDRRFHFCAHVPCLLITNT